MIDVWGLVYIIGCFEQEEYFLLLLFLSMLFRFSVSILPVKYKVRHALGQTALIRNGVNSMPWLM